jgi:putative Holliday junction resolvase
VRRGVRFGIDPGSVRVGIASSDAEGILASPVTFVRHEPATVDVENDHDRSDLTLIASLVAEREALEVIVGRPRSLSGKAGPAERSARAYAASLAARIAPTPVRLVDERFSTVTASRGLSAVGKNVRAQRGTIDAAAAAQVLQTALDEERTTGRPPGDPVVPEATGG